jgi:hypothetical protein
MLLLAAGAALAGCATTPVETPEEARARRTVSCEEAGFAAGTPELRLCLLLRETNERLEVMERRLRFIEQDVQFPRPYYGPRWW